MKTKITTAIFALATAFACADELQPTQSISFSAAGLEKKASPVEKNRSYTYLRMGALDTYPDDSVQIIPGLGLGYRLNTGNGALDLSANYTRGKGLKGKETAYYYTLPKAAYLHYLTPANNQSLYAGAGLAFGGMKNKKGDKFTGLVPNATLGYEMNRDSNFRSFIQLDVSQPALAAETKGTFPGPIAEISLGAGF